MSNTKFFTATLFLALSQGAFAQIPTPPPLGGRIQQIPPAPAPERKAIPDIRIEQGTTPAVPGSDQARILVNSLRVTGQTLYSEAELVAITGFSPGSELTLSDLRGMASKIADHYRRNGYFLAQAYLPAQNIDGESVTIVVLEGRYGSVSLNNQANLSDSLANGLLDGVKSGDTIAISPLESRLLLLSDIPGVNVRSTLVPGAAVGTSDLLVELTPGQRVTGSIEADNAGDRYTGRYRVGATVNINNPTGHGDVLSLRVMTAGPGLKYGRASYQIQFGRATVGVAYTALEYELGEEFESLRAHGTAEVASVYGSYPLMRSRNANLYATMAFEASTFQDKIDLTSSVIDRKTQALMTGLHGNFRDNIGSGGLTSYSLIATAGDLDIETPTALALDAATSRANGNYGVLEFNAARLQRVTDTFSLYGAIYGQFASKNLDISEKMGLGGPYAVRAYPVGEGYSDEGYIIKLEARQLLPNFSESVPGQFHLIGFADTGSGTLHRNPWFAGPNHRRLSGAGIGLTWADYNNFLVTVYWAHKLGNAPVTSVPGDPDSQFWFQLVKYF